MDIRQADLSSYLISYKGHGMIEHATSSNSIGHVVNHEQRHLAQFRDRSRHRNLEIVSENISIEFRLINGKMVAVAGEATTIARSKTDSRPVPQIDIDSAPATPGPESADRHDPAENGKIDRLLNKIEKALIVIDNRLEGFVAPDKTENAVGMAARVTRLESKKQYLESQLARLKAKKLELTQKEILGGLAELISDAADLIGAINALKSGNENRGSSDEYSKIEVPEYSMQYTGLMLDTMI